MYTIERKHYGLHITMGGLYAPGEMETYVREKEKAIAAIDGPFSLLVDLRSAIPPDERDEKLLEECQARLTRWGLVRMAFVVSSPVIRIQARQLVINATVKDQTRLIDASKSPNWEELALNWILYGTEPEAQSSPGAKSEMAV